ncbi:hypothetical protein CKR_3416 [Clostridium kluyveri NBRC 12016]|uniref:Uncharacterized protein n=2 Tax=Clostridium kluyveri TaxID=1534 RepID=A5N402_CLOK5|nr:Hypothetical protein CKL_3871 [Clostridium kluyveri DSM 555]BAH08467.1 hypothetical protein CKR_3416 [Clostridium kluyveri NBRC 12016]
MKSTFRRLPVSILTISSPVKLQPNRNPKGRFALLRQAVLITVWQTSNTVRACERLCCPVWPFCRQGGILIPVRRSHPRCARVQSIRETPGRGGKTSKSGRSGRVESGAG